MTTDAATSLRTRLGAATAILILALGLVAGTARAATADDERDLFYATNSDRAANGLGPLSYDAAASSVARTWSQQMAASGVLAHNPALTTQVTNQVTASWTRLGENVGYASSVVSVENAFMGSSGHRANILGAFNRVGVGTARSGNGTLWVTVVFIKGPALGTTLPPAPTAPAPSGAAWYLRQSTTTGVADISLSYGLPTDGPIACDWDGNGTDTVGIYRNGAFYLRNSVTSGVADRTIGYGMPGDVPVCGDWDGDGTDTIGIYRNGAFYLRNSNTTGGADLVVGYGMPGDRPVVGDWDGDGIDTIGIYRGAVFYLRDVNVSGVADRVVGYGMLGDKPVVGDWNDDRIDTIGIRRGSAFYLRDANSTGVADRTFVYGDSPDAPLTGDWDGNGSTTVGVVRPV